VNAKDHEKPYVGDSPKFAQNPLPESKPLLTNALAYSTVAIGGVAN
jgi:hypothetical protein